MSHGLQLAIALHNLGRKEHAYAPGQSIQSLLPFVARMPKRHDALGAVRQLLLLHAPGGRRDVHFLHMQQTQIALRVTDMLSQVKDMVSQENYIAL
jgi:hypothetical protein